MGAKYCGRKINLKEELIGVINKCHNNSPNGSKEGNRLMHEIAEKTAALDPPHHYVPWVVVDGEHVEDLEDVFAYVCERYDGEKPKACATHVKVGADEFEDGVSEFIF